MSAVGQIGLDLYLEILQKAMVYLQRKEEGGEIDVGAGRCHVVEAREMKGADENADEEEWDILG